MVECPGVCSGDVYARDSQATALFRLRIGSSYQPSPGLDACARLRHPAGCAADYPADFLAEADGLAGECFGGGWPAGGIACGAKEILNPESIP